MLIYLNGEQKPLSGPMTIGALLQELGLADKRVAVEVNEEIVPRSEHAAYQLKHEDRVEVVRAIGGGA